MFSYQVIRRTCYDYQRLRSLSTEDAQVQAVNLAQHEQLLQHIRQGDAPQAKALLTSHLRRLFEEIPDMQARHPLYFD